MEDKNSRLAVNGGLRGKIAEAQALIGQRQLEPALDLLGRAREAALAEQDVESLRDVLRLAERVQFRAKGRGVREQASDLVAAVAADLAPKPGLLTSPPSVGRRQPTRRSSPRHGG